MKSVDLTQVVGGCRRTFIALLSITGLFIFGYTQDLDISNTVASIAIALAAANGAESVMIDKASKKKKAKKDEQIPTDSEDLETP